MRWLFFITLLTFSLHAQSQQSSGAHQKKIIPDSPWVRQDQPYSRVQSLFKMIESGIATCNVDEFDQDLGTIVSITIGSGERRYYSKHQAASVLSEYFSKRKPVAFEFSRVHIKGSAPYATGRLVYVLKGNQESVQVYVSLTKQDSRWTVNQFNMY